MEITTRVERKVDELNRVRGLFFGLLLSNVLFDSCFFEMNFLC